LTILSIFTLTKFALSIKTRDYIPDLRPNYHKRSLTGDWSWKQKNTQMREHSGRRKIVSWASWWFRLFIFGDCLLDNCLWYRFISFNGY